MDQMENTNKLSLFERNFQETTIPGLSSMHAAARAYLNTQDFPTTRVERFKYTRLTKLANGITPDSTHIDLAHLKKHQICADAIVVFVGNGKLILPTEELPKGLHIESIENSDQLPQTNTKDVFAAMNVLYAHAGVRISVEKNVVLEHPVEIVHVCSGAYAGYTRHAISVAENAQAKFVMTYASDACLDAFSHVHTTVEVGANAHVSMEKVQLESSALFSFVDEEVFQGQQSVFQINTMTLDGKLVRNDLHIQVQGEHAETHLNGMYMLNGQQHVANYTTVDHQVPNCESHELYKGIMDDKSVAVFNGKVFVRKDAQKTNAYQSNANVLISEDASVNSKPELEIYADDVKCSHGSTTGQLDDDAIFYLRARGLSEKSAKQLMLTAFMSDVLEKISVPAVKAKVFKTINERFNWELEL